MQRLAYVLLLLVVCLVGGLSVHAQSQLRGQVVNRDGVPQQCQVDFFPGTSTEPQYRQTSDKQGYFYLNNPKHGTYRVVVAQGNRRDEFKKVTIDPYGLHPSTLVVRW